ncbi:hypothetical protein Caci_2948 [Catenulispora acidiphila DSM 44928]|uniref:Uncharacterized protein n=1 Tax=Catenulispora acidiphila (strain DSM 44928 / JCM 14897 / NBRC 102108 / NRRL B-24433 / ID139908) TaxID=479433 RepID=C7Q2W5_CATAD|nr:hypothetical protein [Catenulispora acidiphila]ACU71857.1 hypothetical protein Caci_2948 [Catenulispora acidiphila DSM 44928]
MANEIPPALLDKKREFYTTQRKLEGMRDADPEEWRAVQQRLTQLAVDLDNNKAFEGLSQLERYELDKAASKQARAEIDS